MKRPCLFFVVVSALLVFGAGMPVAAQSASDKAASTTIAYFEINKDTYGMTNPSEELRVKRVDRDPLDMQHVRLDQYYRGVRVVGGEMIAHLTPSGLVQKANGHFVTDLDVDVTPVLGKDPAVTIASDDLTGGRGGARVMKTELVVFPWQDDAYLCWRIFLLPDSKPGEWEYFVDAVSGDIVYKADRMKFGNVIGTGYGVMGYYYDDIRCYYDEGSQVYQLYDYTRLPAGEIIKTFLGNETIPGVVSTDNDNVWNDSLPQNAAVDAHVYTGLLYDWLQSELGRNGFDDAGSTMLTTVNSIWYGIYDNAMWYQGQVVIFRPSGSNKSYAGCPDVVGHEWGHAVTDYCSDLVYQLEPGALNESFSDILGVTFEFLGQTYDPPDWVQGENKSGTPVRSFIDPHSCEQPDYYGTSDPYWYDVEGCYPSSSNDYCGVHTNSGVGNKWFYLLCEGGIHHDVEVDPIEIEDAIQIVYLANAYYWTSQDDYHDAAAGTIDAALEHDPSGVMAASVGCAWHAVGVFVDSDQDGVADCIDNCVATVNPGQEDDDNDGLGNACDNCPYAYNPDQQMPDDFTATISGDGMQHAVYATPVTDTIFTTQWETVSASISNSPQIRTITATQQITYYLYIPALCDTYESVSIHCSSGFFKELLCGSTAKADTGTFMAQAGDVVTAWVYGFVKEGGPDKVPPAYSKFTYYAEVPVSVETSGFLMAGSTAPPTIPQYHDVHTSLSTSPQVRTMTAAQSVSYDLYIPNLCETYMSVGIQGSNGFVRELTCNPNYAQSATGTFPVEVGEVVTAWVDGFYLPGAPDKVPPAYADFSYYDLLPGPADFMVVKTDMCGGEIWTATHGTASDDQAKSALLTLDGGCIVAGYSGAASPDFYVVKFAENGSFQWERTYTNSTADRAASICELESGGYAILGTTDAGGTSDLLLIKTDASGNEAWRQTFGVPGIDDMAGEVKPTTEGGFILVGSTGPNPLDWNVYLVKVTSTGSESWSTPLGHSTVDEFGYGVEQTSDGGFILTGETYWMGTADAHLMKTTGSGALDWYLAYGDAGFDAGYDVMVDSDDNYVLAGKSSSFTNGSMDFYIAKADAVGELLWSTTFGGTADDDAQSVKPVLDGGYLLGGSTESFGVTYSDFYLVKFLDPPPAPPILLSPVDGQYWYTYGSIQVGLDWDDVLTATEYHLMLDNDQDFSSPIVNADNLLSSGYTTPYLGWSTYYWKVRAHNETGWGPWSDVWHFHIYKKTYTSCPVLFSHNGGEFIEENPLLTACEKSGYADVVTDYYLVAAPVAPAEGQVRFQLRELEAEITYLHDIELITVDHPDNTGVACSVDGRIDTYSQVIAPLSAVDHTGTDRLAELAVVDGNLFRASGQGHLIVTFPNPGDEETGFQMAAEEKPKPCDAQLPDDPLPKAVGPENIGDRGGLTVEILDVDGSWVELPSPPAREWATNETVFADLAGNPDADVITLRLSWTNGYSTDAIVQIIPSDDPPAVRTWVVDGFELMPAKPASETWPGFASGEPLILAKGDVFEFSFPAGPEVEAGFNRKYIIRAVGRYEPDNRALSAVIPDEYQLYSNYPNPFNPVTNICYDLPEQSEVTLVIYNVLGQHVTTLVDARQEAGHYQVIWDSKDQDGRTVASGIYFYRLTTDRFADSKKMVLLK